MKVIGDFGNSIVNDLDNVMDEPMFLTENMGEKHFHIPTV